MSSMPPGCIRRWALAAVAVVPLTLGACGSDDDATDLTAPPGATLVVEALNLKFDQDAYTVAAGDEVIAYLGVDAQRHTLEVVDASGERRGDEVTVHQGDVATITTTLEPGTYDLICTVPGHAAAGMTAVLTVT